MKVVPFKAKHLEEIVIQENQAIVKNAIKEMFPYMEANPFAMTVLDGDEVLCCGGFLEINPGRALAWTYISKNIGNRMFTLTKIVKRIINLANYRRVEMDVQCDFKEAHRWAKILGFKMESLRRESLYEDGVDYSLYAKVRK